MKITISNIYLATGISGYPISEKTTQQLARKIEKMFLKEGFICETEVKK